MGTDVLVAGAGPVGLALAIELTRHGAACRIVDAPRPDARGFSRATELHGRTLELVDLPGIADELVAAGLPVARIPFFSRGSEIAAIDLTHVDSPLPASLSVPQADTERILRERLTRAGIEVEDGRRLRRFYQDDEGVTAALDGPDETVRARYLVACEGAHSDVRAALGIAFEGDEYPGRWAAVDADVEGWPWGEDIVPVYLDREGFWAMPLPGGHERLFFRHEGPGDAPSPAEAQGVLDRHLPGSPRVRALTDARCFTIHHRVAARFRAGCVFLAGDAAHVSTPVAGMNMNVGIQDAFNLAWKLALACAGEAADGLLDSYEAERRPAAQAAVATVDAIQEGNLLEAPPAVDHRDRALAAQLATPAEREQQAEEGHELRLAYRESAIVSGAGDRHGWAGPRPGDRITPEPPALRALLRTPRHLLLLCGGDVAPPPPDLGHRAQHVDVHAVDHAADPDLRIRARLGATEDAAYLIRPDAYLGFRAQPPDADALQAALARVLR
jgi:2-polyprenyl-6-methoxyphenol hydroxylase-like FAD-dependent oxidoreductase